MNIVWTSQTYRVKEQIQNDISDIRKQILDLTERELTLWKEYHDLIRCSTRK